VTQRATLQTIADEVGVSRSTVSNAYNHPEQLSPELRERILEKARELDYAGPDPAARRLRHGKAEAVGLLFTETLAYAFSDSAAVRFLEGLASRCERMHAPLLLIPMSAAGHEADAVHEAVVDALCIYSIPDGHPALDAARERRLPTVVVDEPLVDDFTFVGIDDRAGSRLLGEHLTELGHKRIGVIVPRLTGEGEPGFVDAERLAKAAYKVDRDRLQGIDDALTKAGIDATGKTIYECLNREEAGAQAAKALLSADPRPTAIMATTDQLALGAIRGARELGLEVPREVSITGFDDIPEAALADPPLTTARQPLVEKGAVAGDMLMQLARGRVPDDVTLPVDLVVRGSTAPAPSGPGARGAPARAA
jgi:DNA-binding LacI/PurR family transcriptional regulator